MKINIPSLTNFNKFLTNLDSIVEEVIKRSILKNFLPALIVDPSSISTATRPSFTLQDLIGNGFMLYCPTPKKRTTAEKKLTKKFAPYANNFITKYSKPKTNITTCLECGNFHEIGTICTKCYLKVKEETKAIQSEMMKNDRFKYDHPSKELAFVYEDDDKSKVDNSKLIVEIPRKRPNWFNSNLFSKITSAKN